MVFFFDVDNTLLENDRVTKDLRRYLEREVGQQHSDHRSGIFEAVEGNVLIYIHKELELEDAARRYPAKHYVMVDDKLRLLADIKKAWGEKVTTVFPKQGHYALDPEIIAKYPPADISIERIGSLLEYDLQALCSPD